MVLKKKSKYTPEIIDLIREKRKSYSIAEVNEILKKEYGVETTKNGIQNICCKYNIRGINKGCFKKGNLPANKGTKGVMKVNRTSFKKGHESHNKRPIGSERLSKDGYTYIKIKDPNTWKLKHRYLYEHYHNTKLNHEDIIIFLDQNKKNFKKENLYKINQKELAVMNRNYKVYNIPEATKSSILLSKLKLKRKKLLSK